MGNRRLFIHTRIALNGKHTFVEKKNIFSYHIGVFDMLSNFDM